MLKASQIKVTISPDNIKDEKHIPTSLLVTVAVPLFGKNGLWLHLGHVSDPVVHHFPIKGHPFIAHCGIFLTCRLICTLHVPPSAGCGKSTFKSVCVHITSSC